MKFQSILILTSLILANVLIAALSYQQVLTSQREMTAKNQLAKQQLQATEQIKKAWALEKRINPIVSRIVDLSASNPLLQQIVSQFQLDKQLLESREYLERTAPMYDTPSSNTVTPGGQPQPQPQQPGFGSAIPGAGPALQVLPAGPHEPQGAPQPAHP